MSKEEKKMHQERTYSTYQAHIIIAWYVGSLRSKSNSSLTRDMAVTWWFSFFRAYYYCARRDLARVHLLCS